MVDDREKFPVDDELKKMIREEELAREEKSRAEEERRKQEKLRLEEEERRKQENLYRKMVARDLRAACTHAGVVPFDSIPVDDHDDYMGM